MNDPNFDVIQTQEDNNRFDKPLLVASGILTKTKTITNSDVILYDYDSGSTIFLAITGNTDINITLPEPSIKKVGMNFKFIAALSPAGTGDAVIKTNTADTLVTHGIVPTATAVAPVYTLTFSAVLVASNDINMDINDTPLTTTTFATTSDATMQALATKIQADNAVLSAVVTVVGGNQTGTDDRVITVTGRDAGMPVILSTPLVTSGSSQATCVLQNTVKSMNTTSTGNFNNLLADNVKLEAAALGGEWIEFVCDDTYWYCRAGASTTTSLSFNG